MEFGLSEEQTLLTDSLRRHLAERVKLDRVRAVADGGDDGDIWQELSELGVPALCVPEAAGGLGLGLLDAALVAERLGFAVAPTPFVGTAVMAVTALTRAEGWDELLGTIARGERRLGVATAEATQPRADAGMEGTVDAARGGQGRLNGKALFALDAPADHYLIADARQHLWLADAGAEGLTVEPLATIDRTRRTAELICRDTPAACLSTDPEDFRHMLDAGRVMLAADTLGAAQYMLDAAVAYAGEREQFGRPIGSFQAVKHLCAEMAAALEPCRSMVWYAGYALDALPSERRLYACQTKAHLAEVGRFVARTATEVHGGMGFTDLLGLHYWFKRIGANRQLLGAPEFLRDEAAALQGLASAPWDPHIG